MAVDLRRTAAARAGQGVLATGAVAVRELMGPLAAPFEDPQDAMTFPSARRTCPRMARPRAAKAVNARRTADPSRAVHSIP